MNFNLVKEVFDYHVELKTDKELSDVMIKFLNGFTTKNSDHVSFFGGVQLGVQVVRFTQADRVLWLEEYLEIDDPKEMRDQIVELDDIDKNRFVSTDIVNLSFIWILHRLTVTKENIKNLDDARYAAMRMALYKHLTAGIKKRFPHPANPLIALSLYESLDNRSDLKQQGSWSGMVVKKSGTFIEKGSVFTDVIEKMNNNRRVVEFANEIYGSINKMLTLLTSEFHIIHKAQSQIKADSKIGTIDGKTVIKDYISKPKATVDEMVSITRDRNSFIKNELITSVVNLTTVSNSSLEKTLMYFSENFLAGKLHKDLQRDIILFMISAVNNNKIDVEGIPSIVRLVANVFRGSRTESREVKGIKEDLAKVTSKALPDSKSNIQDSARIGLLLYVILRTLTIKTFK